MAHSVFTIVAGIIPKRVDELEQVLKDIQANLSRFEQCKKLHFASFVIFDRDTDEPFLVFENSIDDSVDEYLGEVIAHVEPTIDAVYANCEGYPSGKSGNEKLAYLKAHVRRPQVYHVGTAYRSVESIQADLTLRGALDAKVDQVMKTARGATTGAPSASTVWRELQNGRNVPSGREPRALEIARNWSKVALLIAVMAVLIKLLWSDPRHLAGFLAVVFALKAVWLLILVGWPLNGHIKRAWLIPAAAGLGALVGLLPTMPWIALYIGVGLIALTVMFMIARWLPTARAHQTGGNWPFASLVLLAVSASLAITWIAQEVAHRIDLSWLPWFERLKPLERPGLAVVALVAFVAAFVGLVFISTIPRPAKKIVDFRYRLFLAGGVILTLLFWLSSWWIPGVAPWVLAVISLGLLLGLWDVPLPAPILDVIPASREQLNALKAQEDSGVQNHMAVLVRIRRPYWLRAFLLKLFLRTLNFVFYRFVLPDMWRSTLFDIPTVHFAQWTVLDKKRHMFLSNYDGGWSVYLNDFGVGLNTGLQKIWGQSEGTPGVTDLGKFKEFVRTKMVPHQVWYRAYPGLTSEQIASNETLRRGLLKTQTDDKAAELLRRLSHIEPE